MITFYFRKRELKAKTASQRDKLILAGIVLNKRLAKETDVNYISFEEYLKRMKTCLRPQCRALMVLPTGCGVMA